MSGIIQTLMGNIAAPTGEAGGGDIDLLSDLVFHLDLDQSSDPYTDDSGNGLDFSPITAYGAAPTHTTSGKIGGALQWAGFSTGSAIGASSTAFNRGTKDTTIQLWVNLDGVGTTYPSLFSLGGFNSKQIQINPLGGNRFTVAAAVASPALYDVITPEFSFPDVSSWHHLIVYIDHTAGKLGVRINNTFVTQKSIGAAIATPDYSYPLRLGYYDDGDVHPYAGRFDEFAMWDRKLSPQEMTALYNGGAGLAKGSWI